MPSVRNKLLARVNFPIYTVQCLSERHICVAGGGGGAKTGIRNIIEIYELVNDGPSCRAEPITHYETGNEAVMNCTVYNAGKYFILFTGKEGNCQVYKIKHEVDDGVVTENKNDVTLNSTSVRKRNCSSNESEKCSNSTASTSKSHSKLVFKVQPLESFQTDFSEEPFQKLVRFSSAEKILATGGSDGHIRLWKFPTLNQIFDIEAHTDDVDDIDICPLGKIIVSVSRDGHGKVWDTEDGMLITELEYNLPSKSDGRYIFRSCRFGIVEDKNDLALFSTLNPAVRKKPPLPCYLCKWETKTFSLEKIVSSGTDMLSAMAISDNGHFIGLGTQGGGVKMYIAFSLQLVYNVDNIHGIFVTGLEFLPTCEESRRISGGHEASLISISVDNHIIIHHIPMRGSLGYLTLITLFILALFIIFILMDFFNL